jgi:serine phosphatase RsbU (regulator of sigma subunit)
VIDAPNPRVEPYGEERLHAFLERHGAGGAESIGAGLLQDVLAYGQGLPLEDDVALLVVRIPTAGA